VKERGFTPIVLIVIIAVIAVAGAYYLGTQRDNNNSLFPIKVPFLGSPVPQKSDELLTQSFNKIDTFSFKYPAYISTWKDESLPDMYHYYTDYKSPATENGAGHTSDFRIGVVGPYIYEGNDLNAWVRKNQPSIEGDYGAGPLETVTKIVTFNGVSAIEQSYTENGASVPSKYVVFFVANGNIYQIYFNNQITSVMSLEKHTKQYNEMFRQLLNSLTVKQS
jgi:hypothetical protein